MTLSGATRRWVLGVALAALHSTSARAAPPEGERAAGPIPVDFGRDVRPVLADRCFRCHGPDEGSRKRGLRLDTQEGSRAILKDGTRAIVPGDAGASEAARRVLSDDPDEVMPPPEMNKPLSAEQKLALVDWIRSGAEYTPHWAFVPPRASTPVPVRHGDWARDTVDTFVLARLEHEGLAPAPEADRATLLRRVALALTGLPPTPDEVAEFIADQSSGAYETRVDRLLASPRFGERLAAEWLDVARFADTYGYQSDWECRVWPWRDWLIAAFNSNMPYDEFLREQIAGDLIPGATRDQKLATAFNRLHRQTNEGGSIDAEFRQEYISDRVHTFGTAFLGLTVECARCHDHKYDPVSQRDYYSLGAFFGAIDESGTYPYSTPAVPRPAMRLATTEQQAALARLDSAVVDAERAQRAVRESRADLFHAWLASQPVVKLVPPVRHFPLEGEIDGPVGKATALDGDTGPSFKDVPAFRRCDPFSLSLRMRCPDRKERATVIHTSAFTIESDQQGYQLMLKDGRLCWEIIHDWPGSAAAIRTVGDFPLDRWVHVAVTYDGSSRAEGMRIYLDGVLTPSEIVRDHLDGPSTVHSFQVGFRDRDVGFKGGAACDLSVFDRALGAAEVAELVRPGALADRVAGADRPEESGDLWEVFSRTVDPECVSAAKRVRDARAAQQDLLESIPEIMVMEETPFPRSAYVLTRGSYDQPDLTRPVFPDRAIDALLAFDPSWPRNRLGLAAWATDRRNPLVSRVAVNRLWAICFGRGLAPTLENLGTQGELPTHQAVLDTLAADFASGGWDLKGMLRRIVLCSTFRQNSDLTREKLATDPQNALLSRGPSFRLSAEALRDQALFASGLLVEKVGGPSVKPWQPPGIWEDAGASIQRGYVPDTGDNAHRRSLYTFRKRTAPPPNMLAFDAGSREQCLARRLPTNTPLQPLVVMNDPVFFECARGLALRAATEVGDDSERRIHRVFELLTSRAPRQAELRALRALYDEQVIAFRAEVADAKAVLATHAPDPSLAALTLVCSTVLASDAVVTSR